MEQNAAQAAAEALAVYYKASGRHDLPWRMPEPDGSFDPYKILVSELMLQQTQVARVIPKYEAFLQQFPSIGDVASADLGDVLRAWQGLGYNRRAKFLWQTAGIIQALHAGNVPKEQVALVALPGVGSNTAGAVRAYAYNQPALFLETNVRTVLLHHFFGGLAGITEKQLLGTLEELWQQTDLEPRLFYWALMDYGTYLKAVEGNLNKLSKSYTKQSKFVGSRRQLRGAILKRLASAPQTLSMLHVDLSDDRLQSVLSDLEAEGLVRLQSGQYLL